MKLRELVKNLDILEKHGNIDIDIENVAYDSRKVKEHGVFVAVKGFKHDGHKYITEAILNGAKAVITQIDIPAYENITIIKVKDSRLALAKLSSVYYNEPSKYLDLIGITGTNGKTSTSYLIKSILENAGRKTGLIGTIENIVDGEIIKSKNTTPESLDLQKTFNSMLKANTDICVMEVSSHSLELLRVESSDFNIGIFTNLTPEHLDLHKTMENYLNAKIKLFYKTKDFNIINIDDKYGLKIVRKLRNVETPLMLYGIDNKSDIHASEISNSLDGVKFLLETPKGNIDIKMNIPGIFSVYNGLAAASCGVALDIELENIKKGLESVAGVRGRFEVIHTNRDFSVIIDYAHTPDGYEKILSTVEQFSDGRKIIIFGCGGDRDRTKRPIIGEIAAKHCDLCILTTDNPRFEDPEEIIKEIIKGVKKANGRYIKIIDRKEAIRYAIENRRPKDVILLVGKGHETYKKIGDKILPFNEREIVFEILDELTYN